MTLWQIITARWSADIAFWVWMGHHWSIPVAFVLAVIAWQVVRR